MHAMYALHRRGRVMVAAVCVTVIFCEIRSMQRSHYRATNQMGVDMPTQHSLSVKYNTSPYTPKATTALFRIAICDSAASEAAKLGFIVRQSEDALYEAAASSFAAEEERITPAGIQLLGIGSVEDVGLNPSSVQFHDPPIPLVGTDEEHSFIVTKNDIAQFVAQLRAWRQLFSGPAAQASHAVVIDVHRVRFGDRAKEFVTAKGLARIHDIVRGKDAVDESWQMILLLDEKKLADLAVDKANGVISMKNVALTEAHLHAYAIHQSAARVLLAHADAYTVPLHTFINVLKERKGFNVVALPVPLVEPVIDACIASEEVQWRTARLGRRPDAIESKLLPFYPPLHFMHQAAVEIKKEDT